ncbi:L-type lectin-domain containing receptor kinase IX.1-like [Triticum urartu]|uniref:L-type lectin-domain containing receptor kinase IX.1-like n=1 Tax=Triticum urartu TaxID=4572 RepID=UPI002044050F|nr:L-type lectin-domain containing receptor kinase IX.1-like [Triticum urartu]
MSNSLQISPRPYFMVLTHASSLPNTKHQTQRSMASRRRPTSLVFLVLLYLYHGPRWAFSLSFNLNFSDPSAASSIAFTGDAFPTPSTLELTKDTRMSNIQYSVGRASYAQKVPLWSNATGEMASFTTTFSFRITPDNLSLLYTGDGMAFFLGHFPSVIPRESDGGSLGLLPASTNGTGDTRIVAVEFDTYPNTLGGSSYYTDINGNHIGIDINSLNSTASTDTTTWPGKNLTSPNVMKTATVRYHNDSKMLAVDLVIGDALYQVNATVDLSRYLPEEVAIGFSAATGMYAELHQILSWSFNSTLQLESKKEAPPLPIPASSSNKHKKLVPILLSSLIPLLLLLVCAAVVLGWRRQKKRRANEYSSSDSEEPSVDRAGLERGVAAGGPRRYMYHELVAATSNFAEEEKLGRGGFGSVYRGHLTLTHAAAVGGDQDRRAVAVKVLSAESSSQGRKEFEAEVRIISRLKHRNLVQLLGWCDSRKGLLLVYELVAEGSLDRHLYNNDDSYLAWPQRYNIILGLGSALRYLHGEWEQCILHGDIKPSNIMLDSSLSTKLGDFGLARLIDHGARSVHTTKAVLGTVGYIDPEFVNTRRPCTESDVYSFGVVLLEIVSGRRPVIETVETSFTLLSWVWNLYGRDVILDAADERLRGDEADERWMERVLVVGLWCAHPDRSERPSMAQAMHVLQSDEARLPTLPRHMYRAAQDLASYGSFSVDSSGSGCVRSSSVSTGNTTVSSESSSTALLRHSKDQVN